jgi:hypothetical protein
VGFFFPFYEYPNDSRVYGFQSILMAEGKYEYTNDFLETTGKWEFVPAALIKTQYHTAIPNILPLFPALGSILYKLFGLSGLFYLNPLLSIFLLIISERIASKYFGKYVGLLTLIFLATNEMVFWIGRALLTDTLFSILFLLGTYFLINFLKEKKITTLVIASSFLAATSFIRPNGIIFVPLEVLILIGFFIIKILYRRNMNGLNSNYNYINRIKFRKVISLSLVTVSPWLIFVIFILSFNSYFFGDPTITIYNVPGAPEHFISEPSVQKFGVDMERIDKYLGHFLPYPLNRASDVLNSKIAEQNETIVSDLPKILPDGITSLISYVGIFTFVVLVLSLLISFKNRKNFEACIVFCVMIISLILFYSLNFIVVGRQGSARDMLPVFPIFYILLSYIIVSFLSFRFKNVSIKKHVILKSSKIFLLTILIIFFPISFYFADYSQIIKKEGINLKDPVLYLQKFPKISDPIEKMDIVVSAYKWDHVIYHGAIPFSPIGLEKEFNPENAFYLEMIKTLNDIVSKGYPVYIFKEPGIEFEKMFHSELAKNENFVLKQFSENFCKIELETEKNRIDDVECF